MSKKGEKKKKPKTFQSGFIFLFLLTLSSLSLSKSVRKGFTAFSPTTFMAIPKASKAASRTSGAESLTCCDVTEGQQRSDFCGFDWTLVDNQYSDDQLLVP